MKGSLKIPRSEGITDAERYLKKLCAPAEVELNSKNATGQQDNFLSLIFEILK